ncbi:mCG146885 [Mus musculus]|nr:mCG146885 [Mus musculus]
MFQGEMILSFWWILPHRHDIHIGIKRLSIWNISFSTLSRASVARLGSTTILLAFADVRGCVVVVVVCLSVCLFVYLFCLETGFDSLVLADLEFVM